MVAARQEGRGFGGGETIMTLHNAMFVILREHGGRMRSDALATALNDRGLYRKPDGSQISDWQVRARARQHPQLFGREGMDILLNAQAQAPSGCY